MAKLKQLQRRKTDSAKLNRQELFKEQKNKQNENKVRKSVDDELQLKEEYTEESQRLKNWDYTLEENEKWEAKQELKNSNIDNAGFRNYSQLAEQSYRREIEELNIDKEAYLKGKLKRLKQKDALDRDQDDEIDDYNNKPSKAAIDQLIANLKGSDGRKMKRRKNYEDTSSYINDKNKQFNEKLNRHYDKFNEK
ncbi:hypothetical protein WICMUC_004953 [Wickerhamomyces mucosus]|uniref:Pre-mRNA-splicing factor SYF2 n=1 Tax=Wickerhamomyces mucosus TaxID=1378264 RepID=A0A9P8T908_9ASCO|nr:hypothetical protein WICMUC_004953 [Wickerhamomyces mucosus]